MIIGITYDLREDYIRQGYTTEETAEFDSIDTIEGIEGALRSLGYTTDRVGPARALVERLGQGDRWDLVFNVAEGMHGFGRQALVPALLDAYEVPYTFSDPLTLSMTLHKGMAKHVARNLGIPTPEFAIIKTLAELDGVALAFPLFVKPIAEGTSKGISAASKIYDGLQLRSRCKLLLARHRQPVLVETFLPGREFTVGILGTGAASHPIGVMEIEMQEDAEPDIYSYENKQNYQRRVRFSLVTNEASGTAARIALAAWKGLNCRDGGRVDLRCDSTGQINFLEVNPLAGLNPNESDLVIIARLAGMAYRELIAQIVASALKRLRD